MTSQRSPGHEAFSSLNVDFLEQMWAEAGGDASRLAPEWRRFFEEAGDGRPRQPAPAIAVSEQLGRGNGQPRLAKRQPAKVPLAETGFEHVPQFAMARQEMVDQLVRAYRVRGHLAARINPLGQSPPEQPELQPETYGLGKEDLDRVFSSATIAGPGAQTLREIIRRMQAAYCGSIGVQFMHIDDPESRQWLLDRFEQPDRRRQLSLDEQRRILRRLTDAAVFEEFVRKKYVGAKTFSLEGSESLIPLLDLAIEKAAKQEIDEIVFAMAHRGRLNVLTNIIGKRPREIFSEFADPWPEAYIGRGDVKYHLGFSGDWRAACGRQVHLSLCFNPSHLEFVNPVALGRLRAKQDRAGDRQRKRGMTLLIHGDAAFVGEGIVQETLNLSQLAAYETGGTLHVIVNNQIGFTTSPAQGRSTRYATDVARMLQIPILHVNGEDPTAVAEAIELAMDFRAAFRRDVVIDMIGYRRWGHNESDEPSFTQPLLYRAIEHQQSVRDDFIDHLLEAGELTREEADQIADECHEHLRKEFELVEGAAGPPVEELRGVWQGYQGGSEPGDEPSTGVERETLCGLLRKIASTPADFHLHRKLRRSVERRLRMADGEEPVDWSAAEALAFATLAVEGHPIRLAGQDSERGTFSQRHATLHDVVDGHTYVPLRHLDDRQATVEIVNSPLSEAAVMGFEYGYSLDRPDGLVAWEAQYGDFVNAAQVIVDQFLASAEEKWRRLSGLVLLLPHGFEGQGPEHSSARLERFLMLSAEENIQVVVPTTPAQYFHCLRRQVKRRWRKPLVVMTPKSLLRHPRMQSDWEELTQGSFQRLLVDALAPPAETKRILMCFGKIYFDLREAREEQGRDDVAIVRVEQLYPLSDAHLSETLDPFPDDATLVWVQEEPVNMGALPYWKARFGDRWLGKRPWRAVARALSSSPATGSSASHKVEQQRLLELAFNDEAAPSDDGVTPVASVGR